MIQQEGQKWDKETDVVVVGYGLAGACAAIAAKEAGARVIVVEKQPQATQVTFSNMSGGTFISSSDVEGAAAYMDALLHVEGNVYWTDPDIIPVWARYTSENRAWIESMGGKLRFLKKGGEFPEFPGCQSIELWGYRGLGFLFMKFMYQQVEAREIEVLYETPARELLTNVKSEVVGVIANAAGKTLNIKASRGVILCSGGFEFNDEMKLQYLRVYPSYFDGSPANTGDGIKMAQKVGADLWHMSCVSARFGVKFPDLDIPLKLDFGGKGWSRFQSHDYGKLRATPFILVDRYGRRYISENFRSHCVYYDLAGFDTKRLEFPRVPSYLIFDQKRMEAGPVAQTHSGPAGAVRLYKWSYDNSAELNKGWITTSGTVRELAEKLGLSPDVLDQTVKTWNQYCADGKDLDFDRKTTELVALNNPPFYAIRLVPVGPNTQGGPRRNKRAQIVDPDRKPIPRLYAAGELGSVYGMFYPAAGGNLAECIAFGRIAGENAAREEPRQR